MFILPAVLIVLAMSIFPLIVSLWLSLSRFKLAKGGFTVDFIGTANFKKLLFGSQQFHLLGKLVPPSPTAWLFVASVAGAGTVAGRGRCPAAGARRHRDRPPRDRARPDRHRPPVRRDR